MFGRKQKRIAELEDQLARVSGMVIHERERRYDEVLERLEKFDPDVYQVGLTQMIVIRSNEEARKDYEEMKALHNRWRGRAGE